MRSSTTTTLITTLFLPLLVLTQAQAADLSILTIDPNSVPTTTLDPLVWQPIATIFPEEVHDNFDLKPRDPQGAVVTAAPVPAITQVSPVTTVGIGTVQIIYTQLFTTPLDQWAAPTPGSIGLGTIQGTVGVVKTNRKEKRDSEPTQRPEVPTDAGHVKEERGLMMENKAPRMASGGGSALALVLAIVAAVFI